ncbi:MAG: tetratricopeptide repeat protein [Desulfovibrionaceae bacterium]|nr:tetratricopeptide repeat protein [Desulfovibrionaceae bacterium]
MAQESLLSPAYACALHKTLHCALILACVGAALTCPTVFSAPPNAEENTENRTAAAPNFPASREQCELRIEELHIALRQNPHNAKLWAALGNMYFDTEKPHDAVRAYTRSLTLQPKNPDVLTDLGIMYRSLGLYALAVQSFMRAIRIQPSHENALFNLGLVQYFDMYQHGEGKMTWRRLLALNPKAITPDGRRISELLSTLQ